MTFVSPKHTFSPQQSFQKDAVEKVHLVCFVIVTMLNICQVNTAQSR